MSTQSDQLELIVAPPSTWALRAWLVLKLASANFKTVPVSRDILLDKVAMAKYSDTGLVPVLNDRHLRIHDSLAIAEYCHELFPAAELYPRDQQIRAQARSLTAEVHSGFVQTRTLLPFFIGEPKPYTPAPDIASELQRLENCWANAQDAFYFGKPGIIDAFYGVMAARLVRYGIQLEGEAGRYQATLWNWDLLQEGLADQARW